jgi:hypothetical protein
MDYWVGSPAQKLPEYVSPAGVAMAGAVESAVGCAKSDVASELPGRSSIAG